MVVSLMRLAMAAKGTRAGREERDRGTEHKLSWQKRVRGLTNGYDWLTRWKDGGKSSASIITTQPVCQISAVICIWLVVKHARAHKSTRQACFMDRKRTPGPQIQRNTKQHCTWASVCMKDSTHLVAAVMWNDSCHYIGYLALIFTINIPCKDCFLLAWCLS